MGMWNWLFGGDMTPATTDINPATGLPMVGNIGGVDVEGNPYGVDLRARTIDGVGASGANFEVVCDSGAGHGNEWSG